MKIMITSLIILLTFVSLSLAQISVKVNIKNVRNTNGNIVIAVFSSEKNYKKDYPSLRKVVSKKEVKNGILSSGIELPTGTYGIAILDDENTNDKMDYNFIGMPKEGYGFSNFYHKGFSRPQFSNFVFTLTNKTNTFDIKLRYF